MASYSDAIESFLASKPADYDRSRTADRARMQIRFKVCLKLLVAGADLSEADLDMVDEGLGALTGFPLPSNHTVAHGATKTEALRARVLNLRAFCQQSQGTVRDDHNLARVQDMYAQDMKLLQDAIRRVDTTRREKRNRVVQDLHAME